MRASLAPLKMAHNANRPWKNMQISLL